MSKWLGEVWAGKSGHHFDSLVIPATATSAGWCTLNSLTTMLIFTLLFFLDLIHCLCCGRVHKEGRKQQERENTKKVNLESSHVKVINDSFKV